MTEIQQWAGYVTKVSGDRFTAIVSDLTTRSNPDEEVELPIGNVLPAQRDLVADGAIFTWCFARGGGEVVQSIRFARPTPLTQDEIQQILSEADKTAAILNSE